jgi:CRISPR-associated Csx2 family protein
MAKILIWSLGTGGRISDGRTEYRNAKYYSGAKSKAIETPYIYEALDKFYKFDKCVIVGTAGSGWCSFYENFFPDLDGIDEDYWEELRQMQEKKVHYTDDVSFIRQKLGKIKSVVPKCAEIIVLKYGLNEDEMLLNFEAMSAIGSVINDGDTVSFDITHSFRSLAFYEFLAVSYFKDVLRKNISIDFVSYGMLEYSGENDGYTPIVDLSSLVSLTDWIKSAEEYRRYGTTALLAENLEKGNINIGLTNEEKKILRRLGGDAISVHDLAEFKNLVKNCRNVTKESTTKRKNIALDYIFQDIAKRFGDKLEDDMLLQAELALWHFEKKRYITAAITLVEATIDYCAKLSKKSKDDVRDKLRRLVSSNSEVGDFRTRYNTIRAIRNKLSHAEPLSETDIEELNKAITSFYSTYKKRFKSNSENETDLKNALLK